MNDNGCLDYSYFRNYLLAPSLQETQNSQQQTTRIIQRGKKLKIIKEDEGVVIIL